VVKVKTSIYTDKELWEKYKLSLARKGLEVSQALEELIKEELVEDLVDEALKEVVEVNASEIDFEPVKPKDGLVSIFVRSG
jgi:type II secretory ATPase GspE/PulE/Tfp pilus assembly ATPase PilB-like protein